MASRIASDIFRCIFSILEDIPVKIFRGSMPPEPPYMASANAFFFKLTPPTLISFNPPPPPQTRMLRGP